MANVRISQLPAAPSPITGAELVPIVQNGQTVQTTVEDLVNSPSQTQSFITVFAESSLPNSRYLSGGLGIGTNDNGAQGALSVFLNGTAASLENASTGLIVKVGVDTVVNRSIAAGTAGLSVANGNGISGNPTISLTGLALSAATLSGSGIVSLVGGSYFQNVTLTGSTNQITINNPNGGSNPIFSIADNPVLPGASGVTLPSGGTSSRAALPLFATIRGNSDTQLLEAYLNNTWVSLASGSGVTSVGLSSGLLSSTTNPITSTGVISIDTTVVATLTDTQVLTNKTISGASNTLTNIANASLVNSSVTFNGVTVALGSSGTITATATNALTIGTGLSGTSYNGSSAVTISITATGVTAATYGSASSVPVFAVNAQGQITTVTNTAISIASSAITDKGLAGGVASLDGSGTVPVSQLPSAVLGALKYQGAWNASTNTPTLTSSVGTQGYYYVVDVAGSTNLNGITDWKVGDWAIFNGTIWQKIDNTDAVTSVNGYTGAVVLTYSDVGAPSTSGTGATGTWSISINGNAATATSATTATTATNVAGGAAGSLVYQTGAGATSTLALGTTNYVLTAGASAPQYVAQSTLSVGSATNATNTVNTGITLNSTNANYYLTFVSATTGNLPQLVNSSLTVNPSTGNLTSGIAGGTF